MKNNQESFYSLFHSEYDIQRGKIDPVNTGNQQDNDIINEKIVPVRLRGILIPRIQRDYAQGRKGEKIAEIRQDFVHDLHEAVANKHPCSLNFIYGKLFSPKRVPGEDRYTAELLPLDGQQRLTTLFLLHWYASRITEMDSEQLFFLDSFSYHTRFSSEGFCNFLKDTKTLRPDENEVKWLKNSNSSWTPEQSILPLTDGAVSSFLQNKSNFAASWKNDETVAGMLVMLDAIHLQFHDIPDLWARLAGDDCTIRFNFHILDDVDQDDVFIKMNSRGKLLNEFEYFKADLLQQLKKLDWPETKTKELARKFDTVWEPELWKYTRESQHEEEISSSGYQLDSRELSKYMMRFINFVFDILISQTYKAREIARNNNPDRYNRSRLFRAITAFSEKTSDGTENKSNLSEDALQHFQDILDAWFGEGKGKTISAFFNKYFLPGFRKSENECDKVPMFMDRDQQLLKRCLLQYGTKDFKLDDFIWLNIINEAKMMEDELSESILRSRFRTVRNLFYRMDRGENQLFYILNATTKIMRTGNIDPELEIEDGESSKRFPKSQILEEQFKENLWEKAPVYYSSIRLLEETQYFRGRIRVLLPDKAEPSENDQKIFENRKKAFLNLFGSAWDSGNNGLLRHALLLSSRNLYAVYSREQYHFGASAGDFSFQDAYFARGDENPDLKEAFLNLLDDVHALIERTPNASVSDVLKSVIEAHNNEEQGPVSAMDLRYYLVKYFEPMLNPYGNPDHSWPEWSEGLMARQNESDYDLICFYKHTLGGRFWDPFLAAILTECAVGNVFSLLVHYGSDYKERLYEVSRGIFIGSRKNGFEIKVCENNLSAIKELFHDKISEEEDKISVISGTNGEELRYHHLKYVVSQNENGIDLEDRVQIGKSIVCRIKNEILTENEQST